MPKLACISKKITNLTILYLEIMPHEHLPRKVHSGLIELSFLKSSLLTAVTAFEPVGNVAFVVTILPALSP